MKKLLYVLAAVGLFVACQPEEIQTAFEVAPAKAKVVIKAVDVNDGSEVDVAKLGLTYSFNPAPADSKLEGNVIYFEGKEGSPLPQTEVTVNWSYDGQENASQSISVPAVPAAASLTVPMTIVVGKRNSERVIKEVQIEDKENAWIEGPYYFTPASGHALVEHDGMMWAKNLTEFILKGTVTYDAVYGQVITDVEVLNDAFESDVMVYALMYDYGEDVTPSEAEIRVSAWSYYTAYTYNVCVPCYVEVYADDELVGKVSCVVYKNFFEYEEIANPEGHGHYVEGHGHDHGGSDNAGGGIVVAE